MREREFYELARANYKNGIAIRDTISALGEGVLPHKRAWYWLTKWSDRGYYEYGVSLDLGWFTDKPWIKQNFQKGAKIQND